MRTEIIFFDSSVDGYTTLGSHLPAHAEAVVIDYRSNGLNQVRDHLKGRRGIDAIHLVSHGSAGALCLGADVLSLENLHGYQQVLGDIGAALKPDGDILLYGCRVAAGDAGMAFVAGFAALTGVNVAASAVPTGATALGGDALLEVAIGDVGTRPLFSQAAYDDAGVVLTSVFGFALTDAQMAGASWLIPNPANGFVASNKTLSTSGQIDIYRFMPDVTGNYTISVLGIGLDSNFRVYSAAGINVTDVVDDNFASVAETTTLSLNFAQYRFVAVSSFSTSLVSPKNYTIQITGSPAANVDAIPTAAPTFVGTASTAIDYAGDTDFFSLDVPTNATTLTLRASPSSTLDIVMRVYTSAASIPADTVDALSNGGSESKTFSVPAGVTKVWVGISSFSNSQTGTYSLVADFDPDNSSGQTIFGNGVITGTTGNDVLTGGAGVDFITGGSGNDVINGGGATDTATYSGARSSYTVTKTSAHNFTVRDNRSGSPDGTDTISNVEKLQFSDKTLAIDADDWQLAVAAQLCLASLARAPTKELLAATALQIDTNQAPSVALQSSLFSQGVADGFYSASDSANTLVSKVFSSLFGRPASQFDLDGWSGLIALGVAPAQLPYIIFSSLMGATNISDSFKLPGQSRLIAAQAYTDALTTTAENSLTIGSAGAQAARAWLAPVTSQATAAAKIATVSSDISSTFPGGFPIQAAVTQTATEHAVVELIGTVSTELAGVDGLWV